MAQATLAFIGGGNMAGAIFGGLVKSGWPPEAITVIELAAEQRERIATAVPGLRVVAAADAALAICDCVVWAVKPQSFADAAAPCAPFVGNALHLSVMAGIRSDTLARATRSERIVRAMPNTPALIGRGIAGLYARAAVSRADRSAVEAILAPTGQTLWLDQEAQLDAVTALSGSGPAYVFYMLEAMLQAGTEMGLSAGAARQLALATFDGAAALAAASSEAPETLRARVTSKGGTTYAAITELEASGVKAAFVRALHAAGARAEELGRA